MKTVLHCLSQRPSATGSGVYLDAMVREAGRRGWRQGVLAVGEVDFPVELPFPVVGMSDVMPYPSRTWSSLTEAELAVYEKVFADVLRRAVDELQPDVLHCHHLWVMTALARRLFPNLRIVASCHGTELRQMSLAPEVGARVIEPCRALDAVFALTEAQAEQLREVYGLSEVHVMGAGFRDDVFTRRRPRVIYAGKLARAKGVPWLLEAVEGLELDLVLAGAGDEVPVPEGQRLGMLSQEQLAEEFRRSDLFVLPSFYEGLPLVLLEALACGCRVVVTDLPGVRSWLTPELEPAWVRRVPLPRLIGADEPEPQDLPGFVARLRQAIVDSLWPPGVGGHGWGGVFERIERFYLT